MANYLLPLLLFLEIIKLGYGRQSRTLLDDREVAVTKIRGGSRTQVHEPYMALLRGETGYEFCAGTLIHPRVVLTAAHCLEKKLKPTVDIGRQKRIGSDGSGYQVAKTLKTIINPDYSRLTKDNDAALLVLEQESSKKTVELYEADDCRQDPYGTCDFRILGWGGNGQHLKEGFVVNVSLEKCEIKYSSFWITDSMMCAAVRGGGVDTCKGDSGGPLLYSGKQIGITSWGIGCGVAGNPGVYTSVPQILPWIRSELAKLTDIEKTSQGKSNPCDCSIDGISGGVVTTWKGCGKHAKDFQSNMEFCFVQGGSKCKSAIASDIFPGAAWKVCH